jgi:hypothetical protein
LPLEYTAPGIDEEVLAVLGKRSGLDAGEHPYLDHVGRDSFYGFLALHREELFRDEDFSYLYCPDNGRPSVPPSLLATALLLQAYEGVSEEAKARAEFDLRWKAALGAGLEERPFAKSTLQLFRARLLIHERVQTVFRKSLEFARDPPAGGSASGGEGIPAKRGVRTVSQATSGRRT